MLCKRAGMTKLQFILCTSLLAACSKSSNNNNSEKAAAGGASTKGGAAVAGTAPDPSKFGGACKNSFDCPRPDFHSACSVECERPSGAPSDQPGYCQLRDVVAQVGAQNCYGNRRGVESEGSTPSVKTPVLNYCDINAGVYCNMGSHACEAVKAIGAACASSDECGKDGACQAKVCVAAGAPGAAPVERRCASSAYRQGEQCIERKPTGQTCKESDECQSFNCVMDGTSQTCKDAAPAACVLK
jgi:hypothetical protein